MKSLGDTLIAAREERGLSIDQAVHETNISRHYLEALEKEDFAEFPAEAYLIGFLRNYADFLGIDSDKIVGQFKNYKLSEEPTPIEELIGPPKGRVARKVFLWVVLTLIIAVVGFFGIPRLITAMEIFGEQRAATSVVEESKAPPPREIRPSPPLWEGEVRPGDTLRIEGATGEVMIALSGDEGRLKLDGGSIGNWSMLLGEEIYIPSHDGRPAWRLYLKDIGLPNGGAVVEIQELPVLTPEDGITESEVEIEPPSGDSERRRESRVIFTGARPERFTLDITFRDFSLFRYKVDGQESVEAYYGDGDDFRLDVGRSVTIWASNAGALYTKIAGEEVVFGRRGEVVAGRIQWVLDEGRGEYRLTLLPLY